MKPKLKHYKFIDSNLASDITNAKGNIVRYKEVHTSEYSEEKARVKAKIDEGYTLVSIYELGKDWSNV